MLLQKLGLEKERLSLLVASQLLQDSSDALNDVAWRLKIAGKPVEIIREIVPHSRAVRLFKFLPVEPTMLSRLLLVRKAVLGVHHERVNAFLRDNSFGR